MGQALYRKYRSKSLDEVVGQEHITTTLAQAIKQGRIAHAYLFTGPRGVGKTSIARILAHQINDLPYTDDSSDIDIIEIDAASNRRIDEIRDLREKVFVAPAAAKYKVYIIDEVHMLTREAFNALLKTLEEPPAHVVFILATTDAHKLPETIVSRTQRFTFRPIEPTKVVAHLRHIADSEKLDISDNALELLAEHGQGSFRDSISLLDQATSHGARVERTDVESMLGIAPDAAIDGLLQSLDEGASVSVKSLLALYDQGYQPSILAGQLGNRIRDRVMVGKADARDLRLLERLLEVAPAHSPSQLLELVIIEASSPATELPSIAPSESQTTIKSTSEIPDKPVVTSDHSTPSEIPKEDKPEEPKVVAAEVTPGPAVQVVVEPEDEPIGVMPSAASTELPKDNRETWQKMLQELKVSYNTLYGVVRLAEPEFTEDELILKFGFAFHQKRCSEAKNQQILSDILSKITGQDRKITCTLDKLVQPKPPIIAMTGDDKTSLVSKSVEPPAATAPKNSADLEAISNIFGGAELLQ